MIKEVRPAIIFDDEVKRSEVNTIFGLPYKLKFVADNMKSLYLDNYRILNTLNSDFYNYWYEDFLSGQKIAVDCSIIAYIEMNILELFRVNVLGFLQKNLDKYFSNKFVLYDFSNEMNKLKGIRNVVSHYNTELVNIYSLNQNDLALISLEQVSDILISNIVMTYDQIIVSKINYLIQSDTYKPLYQDLYREVYNDAPESYNLDYIFTFLASILRSIAEEEILKIRNALSLVMKNAADMYSRAAHLKKIGEPEYTNDKFLEDTGKAELQYLDLDEEVSEDDAK